MKYFSVIGNRDHIKIDGEKRPFWEFLDVLPDGWLTSLVYKRDDVPIDRPQIWDCGAWSYKTDDVPKITSTSAAGFYDLNAASYARCIAPDHMLIDGVDHEFRRGWNLAQAARFIDDCPQRLVPMATIHGQTVDERLLHADALMRLGYRHLAIGGIAARASQPKVAIDIVERLRAKTSGVSLHVLGLSSPRYMKQWHRIGVDSCDGSSHFKQAFTAGAFFTQEGEKLTKHKAARPGEEITAPECDCKACEAVRTQGIDTRTYGSNETNMGRAAHNLNMLMRAHRAVKCRGVGLVACCGQKGPRGLVSDIYQSPLFRKSRAWVEQECDRWFVLSAKHGLCSPDQIIDPYDLTLNDMSRAERDKWAAMVSTQLNAKAISHATVLAGNRYRHKLDVVMDVPLASKGIGQQLQWLDANVTAQGVLL